MKFHKDGTLPRDNEVFVFGSNLAGVHGAGAAKQATKYGARYGQGVGAAGRSFAIPTKDNELNTLKLDHIKLYIDRFVKITHEYPLVNFFITRVGCDLAGYKDSDIAPLFKECNTNCSFTEQWKVYLVEWNQWH